MSHQVVTDLSTRSTPALIRKLAAAIANGEKAMEDACVRELDRRGEHPHGERAKDD